MLGCLELCVCYSILCWHFSWLWCKRSTHNKHVPSYEQSPRIQSRLIFLHILSNPRKNICSDQYRSSQSQKKKHSLLYHHKLYILAITLPNKCETWTWKSGAHVIPHMWSHFAMTHCIAVTHNSCNVTITGNWVVSASRSLRQPGLFVFF